MRSTTGLLAMLLLALGGVGCEFVAKPEHTPASGSTAAGASGSSAGSTSGGASTTGGSTAASTGGSTGRSSTGSTGRSSSSGGRGSSSGGHGSSSGTTGGGSNGGGSTGSTGSTGTPCNLSAPCTGSALCKLNLTSCGLGTRAALTNGGVCERACSGSCANDSCHFDLDCGDTEFCTNGHCAPLACAPPPNPCPGGCSGYHTPHRCDYVCVCPMCPAPSCSLDSVCPEGSACSFQQLNACPAVPRETSPGGVCVGYQNCPDGGSCGPRPCTSPAECALNETCSPPASTGSGTCMAIPCTLPPTLACPLDCTSVPRPHGCGNDCLCPTCDVPDGGPPDVDAGGPPDLDAGGPLDGGGPSDAGGPPGACDPTSNPCQDSTTYCNYTVTPCANTINNNLPSPGQCLPDCTLMSCVGVPCQQDSDCGSQLSCQMGTCQQFGCPLNLVSLCTGSNCTNTKVPHGCSVCLCSTCN